MSVVKFGKQKSKSSTAGKENPRTGAGDDGICRYIETDEHGRAWITTAATDERGNPNPPVNAENIRRLLPNVAEQLRAQGAARRPNTASNASNSEVAAKAVQDERARIKTILDLPHAKGRERLAEQLALTEGMNVERAEQLLAVAPVEHQYVDGALASEPDDDARKAADRAVQAARGGGYIR